MAKGDLVKVGAPLVVFAEGVEQDTGTVVGNSTAAKSTRPPRPWHRREVARRRRCGRWPPISDVDLNTVQGTGPDNTITRADVERAARWRNV